MACPPFLRLAPLVLLLPACASAPPEVQGPADFIRHHYATLRIGADWDEIQQDFTPDALIVRHDVEQPGLLVVDTVPAFFEVTGPTIDGFQAFRIEPVGLRALVYDRIATVLAHVEVESVDAEGAHHGFRAVDQFALALDDRGRWRITHLLYQRVAEGWEPPRDSSAEGFLRSGWPRLRGEDDEDDD